MDKILDEDLEPYIDERINHNVSKFKKSKKWKELYKKFSEKYDILFENPENADTKKLEELYASFNNLSMQEQYLVYKIGFVDGIKLREEIRDNKNS